MRTLRQIHGAGGKTWETPVDLPSPEESMQLRQGESDDDKNPER